MRLIVYLCLFAGLAFAASPSHAKTYSKDYFGETVIHRAVFEDTLVHLARSNGLGFVEMRAANPTLDPWIPGAGAKVVLPNKHILPDAPRTGIVINLPDQRLYYFPPNGGTPLSYSIGVGREGLNTPLGQTTVNRKIHGPTWTPTPRMRKEKPELPMSIKPFAPDNPMGTHALYLGFPQIAIHGTDKPYGIGRRVSSGCIRMYPEGIVDLYPRVPVGTKVTVVDQPVKVGWVDDKMYVEVAPTQDQSFAIEENGVLTDYVITTADMKRITQKAGKHASLIDWESVREAVKEHTGYPVPVLDLKRQPGQRVKDDLKYLLQEAGASHEEVKLPASEDKTQKKAQVDAPTKKETAQTNNATPATREVTPASSSAAPRTRVHNFNVNN